ncbi:MAG TPA: PilN domain-containing protein [Tepidisphaeraceae bacterium]|jgi:hypothetical protein|nr:PilN domain-containing protein [Tepidisphaeraceae bacterium]
MDAQLTAPNELSFLPEDYLEQKYKRRVNTLCVLLVLAVGSGLVAAFHFKNKDHKKIVAEFNDVNNAYVDAARKIEQVKKMQAQQRELFQHAEITASLKERVPRSNMLAELTNALPVGVSLLDMGMTSAPRQSAAPVANSSFAQHAAQIQGQQRSESAGAQAQQFDVRLKLTGVARDDIQVAQLISRLSHNPMFQEVNLVVSESFSQGRPDGNKAAALRRWQLDMMLNPHAEVRDDSKTAAVELSK